MRNIEPEYEEPQAHNPVKDLKARIEAMTPEEKGQLADEMKGEQDFLNV